jgi:AmmeMemoRadiSam system protein B/AmmeMemoRadiSam system protein A
MSSLRAPAVAGSFYPGLPAELRAEVGRHLAPALAGPAAADEVPPKILVVPHAGYNYSGATAARAYALLAPVAARIRRVVLLGPAHRARVRGLAAPTVAAFDTPLGPVRVDHAAMAPLRALEQVGFDDTPHAPEYSLEVQLPFLQAVLGNGFGLVPLVVGDTLPEDVAEVMDALWGGDETLFVVSTDMSHFHPYADAQRLDQETAARILRLESDIHPLRACGARPLNGALLAARRRRMTAALVDLCNSGDTVGRKERVVGYASFALRPGAGSTAPTTPTGRRVASLGPAAPAEASAAPAAGLGEALLLRARNTIAQRLGVAPLTEPAHPALQQRGATFVTLNDAARRLRGCIGRLEAVTSLDSDVRHNAEQAAFADPRFPPVRPEEWTTLRLEVSVLTSSEPLPSAPTQALALQAIQPGVHGVIFEWQGHRATFLPQVWAQLPEPQAFMAALKRKAGLAEDFWAADVRLSRYRVDKHDGGAIAALGAPVSAAGAAALSFGSLLGGGLTITPPVAAPR